MSIRALSYLRPAVVAVWAGLVLVLAGCAAPGLLPADGEGQLFARGLDEIDDLYIDPVSNRQLALSALARLTRLDGDLGVSDNRVAGALVLSYDGRGIGVFTMPDETNGREWGNLLAAVITAAKDASPGLAVLPQDAIDEAVFDGMTAPLDRFSHYSPPKLARAQRAARDGFGGIGVTLEAKSDIFRVTAVMSQGPADRAGIRPQDQIVAIDGVATSGRSYEEVARQLRGPVGSAVALSVLRPGAAQPGDLRLSRTLVIAPTVTVSRDGDIAVFHIGGFNRSTTQRIADGLAQIRRQEGGHLTGIVLDLRNSPGGLLDQAVSLADLFIDDGPIVSTVGRHPASHQYFAASGAGIALETPLAVLINGGSASAAEILAAALQDVGRAVVIGSSSYGKGTVQTVLRLPNDGELTLTWARLITPSGYYLQTHGVVPTLCTADLNDGEQALELGLQQVDAGAAGGPPAAPRAALDEHAWSQLRRACPGRRTSPAIDLKLAARLLADPKLYRAAQHALTRAPHPSGGAPALTDLNRALSSRPH
ncbi:MAG TPA: S41 family peptidase [Stellaceae bacterium]|nr:S41 family peptidase [Stellaceae bacterium]